MRAAQRSEVEKVKRGHSRLISSKTDDANKENADGQTGTPPLRRLTNGPVGAVRRPPLASRSAAGLRAAASAASAPTARAEAASASPSLTPAPSHTGSCSTPLPAPPPLPPSAPAPQQRSLTAEHAAHHTALLQSAWLLQSARCAHQHRREQAERQLSAVARLLHSRQQQLQRCRQGVAELQRRQREHEQLTALHSVYCSAAAAASVPGCLLRLQKLREAAMGRRQQLQLRQVRLPAEGESAAVQAELLQTEAALRSVLSSPLPLLIRDVTEACTSLSSLLGTEADTGQQAAAALQAVQHAVSAELSAALAAADADL